MPFSARITHRSTLLYGEGPDPALDRPAHVRAGSGLRLVDTVAGPRLVVAQDDASFLALVDPVKRSVSSIALPPGPNGMRLFGDDRGNKKDKLDLECVETFVVDGRPLVVALGSGSLPARQKVVLLHLDRAIAELLVIDASPLYAALRSLPLLRGCELNLEGMCRVPASPAAIPTARMMGARVRLFQRGNGGGGVDATIDVDEAALLSFFLGTGPVPHLNEVRAHVLGDVDGVRLTFTDACTRGARVFVTAAAEASPNAVDDGAVVGCALGYWDNDAWTLGPIFDESGARWVGKPEGLALDPDDETRAWIVVDRDDPHAPAEP